MLLYYSPTSPFARKARVVVREHGLKPAVNEMTVNPYEDDPSLILANPLGQVPTLVLNDGQVLLDSPVICAYLDALGDGPSLFPAGGRERWRTLTHVALADGVMTQALSAVMERRRSIQIQNPDIIARALSKIERALGALERYVQVERPWNMAHVALASALGYLEFRHPDYLWKPVYPDLAKWFAIASERLALADTSHYDPLPHRTARNAVVARPSP